MCIMFFLYIILFGKKINHKIWPEFTGHTAFVNNVNKTAGNCEAGGGITPEQKRKQMLSIGIMAATIIALIVVESISKGTIAIMGTLLVIMNGCISIDEMYRKFDWTTVFVLAGGIGFANGLDKSGGGRLLAETISGFFGASLTPMHVYTILVLAGAILTVIMSNTAVAAMLTPIAVAFTSVIDFNLLPVMMGICMATNCSFLTPLATPSMTMVLGPGEYKFTDYIKYCLLFNILAVLLLFLIIPRVWPL